jgi:hypothetical protein
LGRQSRRPSALIRRKVTGFAALNPSYALTRTSGRSGFFEQVRYLFTTFPVVVVISFRLSPSGCSNENGRRR